MYVSRTHIDSMYDAKRDPGIQHRKPFLSVFIRRLWHDQSTSIRDSPKEDQTKKGKKILVPHNDSKDEFP